MKIEVQIMKDKNQIKGIIKRLPVLNHLFNRDISFIKDGLKKNISPPSFKHLIFLSNFIKKKKKVSCLEFGVGWSSLVIAEALEENRKKFSKNKNYKYIKQIFKDNTYRNCIMDGNKKYINIFKKLSFKSKIFNIKFNLVNWKFVKFDKNTYAAKADKLPQIIPDLFYLDGPDPMDVKKPKNENISLNKFPIIISDLLFYENYLNNDCSIVAEGRAHNVIFLKKNLQRNWTYRYLPKIDTHILTLKENIISINFATTLKNYYD